VIAVLNTTFYLLFLLFSVFCLMMSGNDEWPFVRVTFFLEPGMQVANAASSMLMTAKFFYVNLRAFLYSVCSFNDS